MSTAFHHLKFKQELAKQLIREMYGPEALAELEAQKELKQRKLKKQSLAILVREMKVQELKERMEAEALPEAARLVEDLEDFLTSFGEKFDSYQETVRNLQLQLVRTWLATQYLEKALSQLDNVKKKIRDMQSVFTIQVLEEKISALASRQRKLTHQIREKIHELKEELSRVDTSRFNRKPISTLQAKTDLESLSLLLEAELGVKEDTVEKNFHQPLPAEPTPEEREVEEEEVKTGRRR